MRLSHRSYWFSCLMANVDNLQLIGDVQISTTEVKGSSAAALGVEGGARPLYVIAPTWTRRDVGQATFVPGALNTISATLGTNFELPTGTVVVIGGLLGSPTADGDLQVSSVPGGVFSGAGQWTQKAGELQSIAVLDHSEN